MNEFNELDSLINNVRGDVEKAAAGNKAAQTRVRVKMQEVKRAAQNVRLAVETLRANA